MTTVTLAGSLAPFPIDAVSSYPASDSDELKISLVVRRGAAAGITLEDYAQGLISGAIVDKLNHADFDAMFAPTQADIDAVCQFAVNNGLTVHKIYTNSATIKLTGCVYNFNQAFGTTIFKVITATREYYHYQGTLSIPVELDGIILAVFGLDNSLEVTRSSVLGVDNTSMTPQQIATAYNFPAVGGQGQCVGIIEFGGGYTTDNLTGTFSRAGISPTPNVVGVSAGGQNNPDFSAGSQEVMLDVYIVAGLIPEGTTAVYFGANAQVSSWWNTISTAINDTQNNPSVLSISWGANELLWGSYIYQLDLLFLSAMVKGITIVVASGDSGSRADPNSSNYTVQYPAASPYVLSCGGTIITNNNISTEAAWNYGYASSGGGVSRRYPVPSYQARLTTKAYPAGTVSSITGRAVPDVSGHAVGYQFYFGIAPGPYGTLKDNGAGTSAVAPIYAGLLGRINQAIGGRCGFVNNFIYSNTTAFQDIKTGNNAGPATVGYSATQGWDACTGLGSPNGVNIMRAVVSQPAPIVLPTIYPTNTYGSRPTSGETYPRTKINFTN